jgi:hypothetical protein
MVSTTKNMAVGAAPNVSVIGVGIVMRSPVKSKQGIPRVPVATAKGKKRISEYCSNDLL